MANNLSSEQKTNVGLAAVAEQKSMQVALRLRAVDRSDRPIVSNVSAVHATSGMVFVDFGFIEQQAIDEVTRAMRTGAETAANIDGRLECRVAMSIGDLAQLSRQLQQVLSAVVANPASLHTEPDANAPRVAGTSLQ
jgi:hypothetical protein